jgi:hypothetical protein
MKLDASVHRWFAAHRPSRVLRAVGAALSLLAVIHAGPASGAPRMECGRSAARVRTVVCGRCDRASHRTTTPTSRACCRIAAAAPAPALPHSTADVTPRDDARFTTVSAIVPAFATVPALVSGPPPGARSSSPPPALAAAGASVLRL